MKVAYKAATKDGEVKEGIIEARDIAQAVYFIRSKDMLPVTVKEKKESSLLFPFLNGISSRDLAVFTRQIASIMSSGLTLIQALSIMKDQARNTAMKEMLTGIMADIQEGKSFSYAINKYPQVFSPVYISLIKSGETSGLLDKIFERLADTLEKNQKLKSTIISALIYPAIIVILIVAVVIVLMIFVIPQLESLYKNLNSTLPASTRFIIALSHFMTNFWPIMLGLIVLTVFLYRRFASSEFGKVTQDKIFISIPLIGKLIRFSILTEFSRTLGLLINAGTLVVESLAKTADVAGNKIYQEAIIDVSKRVEKGISIGDAMATYDIFPPVLVQMVKIGEQTGKLDESLLKVSEYFEREVEVVVKGLTTAIEPVIMIVLGLGVAFLLFSVLTPIYNVTNQIH